MFNALQLLAQATESTEAAFPPPPRTEHEGSYWFPETASTFAKEVDGLFMLIFWVSLLFFVAIIGVMIYFVIKYRHRPGHEVEKSPSHNTLLEIAWSVLPGFLLVWFFVDGANGFFHQRIVPGDAEEIQVVANQFKWVFYYPNGDSTTELHLVRNRPTKFVMESEDVLHSFFVPAFRQKQDLVPGRYTYTWVQPTKSGTYRLYCTEYCGDGHSLMKTNVVVHNNVEDRDKATFYDWEKYGETEPIKNGQRLFNMKCSGCHNPTTVKKTGPGLAEIWGTMENTDKGPVKVDENYFRTSLIDPNAHIVDGYAKPSQMQTFKGLTPDQIRWLMIYIKSKTPGAGGVEPIAEGDGKAGDGKAGDAKAGEAGDAKKSGATGEAKKAAKAGEAEKEAEAAGAGN